VSPSAASTFTLAEYYVATDRPAEAIAQLEPLTSDPAAGPGAKVRLARARAVSGELGAAHTLLDEVVAQNAKNTDAQLLKGQLLLEDGKRDEALERVRAAAEAAPRSTAAQFALGQIYSSRGDVSGAQTAFQKVLEINPQATAARVELSRLQLASGRHEESWKSVSEAAKQEPNSLEVRLALVRSLIASREFAKAQLEVDALTALYPNLATVHVQRGMLAGERKDAVQAKADFDRALALDPRSLEAAAALVALHLSRRDTTAVVDTRIADGDTRAEVLMLSARTHALAGDLAAAETLLRKTIDVEPSLLPAYAMLGQIYLRQKKLDQARQEYDALAQRQSRPVGALTMAGIIYQVQGNTTEARRRFEQVLSLDPRAAVAANNLAWMYAEGGDNLDAALQLAQAAIVAAPESPEIMDTLGWIYYKKKLPEMAIQAFTRAVEKAPSNPTYRYHLGLAQAMEGDEARAERSLSKALELRPDFPGADDARKTLSVLGTKSLSGNK
jgi:tetratricopeptide (TPR) repeat protein